MKNDFEVNSGNNRIPTGRLIKITHLVMRREFENLLRPHGITIQQLSTLGVLCKNPGMTHTDLEQFLMIERASVTSVVTGMVRNGWVIRREHPNDARYKQVFPTEEGKRLLGEIGNFPFVVEILGPIGCVIASCFYSCIILKGNTVANC